jgi:hypothetical protein
VGEARAWTICSQWDKRRESNTGGEERQLEAGSGEKHWAGPQLLNTQLLIGGFNGVRRHVKLESRLVVGEDE